MNYNERFMNMVCDVVGMDDAIAVVIKTKNSFSKALYKINGTFIISENEEISAHSDFDELSWDGYDYFEDGIHLYRFSGGECIDMRHIPHFVPETFVAGAQELAIYQEYGLEPENEYERKCLEDAKKAEKIKDSLVWACYTKNREKAKDFLESPKLKAAQLNKVLKLEGTPLIICAKNDDLELFKAIVDKGADLTKKISCEGTPLMTAFRFSYDIVKYIFDEHREQFDKEVKDFHCAIYSQDIRTFELLKNLGLDYICEGERFPILHSCVDAENLIGVKFLLDNGVDIELKNKMGQTALDRAEGENRTEIIEFLRTYQK